MQTRTHLLKYHRSLLTGGLLAAALCCAPPILAQAQNQTPLNTQSTRLTGRAENDLQAGQDADLRRQMADRLKEAGVVVDWRKYDTAGLVDIENRVECAHHLKDMGIQVDWRKYTSDALTDMDMRATVAQRLAELDVHADWRKYSLQTLMDMEAFVQAGRRLKQAGAPLNELVKGITEETPAVSRRSSSSVQKHSTLWPG